MAAINEVIDLKADGNIAVISVNSPPVNALSQNVREGLQEALNKALADPNADVRKAAVLALTRLRASEAARAALATATTDSDADVRAYAGRAL